MSGHYEDELYPEKELRIKRYSIHSTGFAVQDDDGNLCQWDEVEELIEAMQGIQAQLEKRLVYCQDSYLAQMCQDIERALLCAKQ
jgi:hypothetical protein